MCRDGKILRKLPEKRSRRKQVCWRYSRSGFVLGSRIVKDKKTKKCFDCTIGFGIRVQQASFERGVAVLPKGVAR